jgi:acyl dehydratase
MRDMALILDDPNQIHLDPGVVRALGLGDRVINQGPSNCGYIMNMLLAAFPGAGIRSFRARFLASVFAGDSVVAGGQVVEETGPEVTCAVWLDVVGGERAVDGVATLTLGRQRPSER